MLVYLILGVSNIKSISCVGFSQLFAFLSKIKQ